MRIKLFMVMCLVISIFLIPITVQAEEVKSNKIVDTNKIWEINFNKEVDIDKNLDKIQIKDSNGKLVKDIKITIEADNKTIKVLPPTSGYVQGENYILEINNEFISKDNQKLKDKLIIPFSVSPTVKQIHAFYPINITYGPKTEAFIKEVDSLSFPWSHLEYKNNTSDRTINIITDYSNSNNNYNVVQALKYSKANGKSTQLNIFADDNADATKKIISSTLPDESKRRLLIENIVSTLKIGVNIGEEKAFVFDGVVIDFEGLRNSESIDGMRMSEYFNEFLKELRESLDKLDSKKNLYVAANVNINFDGYDYPNILKYADKLILMAHDYEPIGNITKNDIMKYINYDENNNINSLAPIKQVEKSLEATTKGLYGTDLSKIWLQISFDSAQWEFSLKNKGKWDKVEGNDYSMSHSSPFYSDIKARLDGKIDGANLEVKYINELQSPYISYYNTSRETYNFILYENAQSVKAKIDIANKYGISGISIWQWGNVPDYDDENGKKYNLNVWSQLVELIKK